MTNTSADAWAVIYGSANQYTALFLDQAKAAQYAAQSHGELKPLVFVEKNATTPSQKPERS